MTNSTFYIQPVCDFKRRMYRRLTLALFFILPSRLTKVFVSLSILSLVFSLRNERLCDYERTVARVGKMLNLHINNSVLLLPHKTCQWYWSDSLLDTSIETQGKILSLREMLVNNEMFLRHRHTIITHLLDSLPKSINIKLGLARTNNRLTLKHNITSALMYI